MGPVGYAILYGINGIVILIAVAIALQCIYIVAVPGANPATEESMEAAYRRIDRMKTGAMLNDLNFLDDDNDVNMIEPLGEISGSAEWACKFACNIRHGRFIAGEAAISSDPAWSYQYAKNALRARFIIGEPAIATHPEYACLYAIEFIKKPWPDGEDAIKSDPHTYVKYKRELLEPFNEWERDIIS